ncbi:MAG: extracellular solute-binding protein [Spirochaetales bacterium]|nr:extracellular solute-binding protein [Spirochaetales bacterium]
MKRILLSLCIFAVSLTITFFSGCRNKSDSMDLFNQEIKTGNLEPVTLTLYFIDTWRYKEEELRIVLDEIEKRTKKTLNITLNFKFFFFYDYYTEIEKVITNGEPCDMFAYNTWSNSNILPELYYKGLTLDITTMFPQYAPGLYSKLDPGDLTLHKIDGKLLAVPNHFPYINKMCVSVRDDLMKKYNIPPIKNLDDMETYMDAVKKNEEKLLLLSINDTTLGIFAPAFHYVILDYQLALVYKWDDPEMKIIPWEQTPEFPEAIERAYNWYKKGYLQNGYFYLEPDPGLIRSGTLAAILGYQLSVFDYNTLLFEENANWRYLEYPLFPDVVCQPIVNVYEGMIVSPNSENPERALMFIDWIYTNQKNYDLIRYGILNRHYQLRGDQYAFPKGVTGQNAFLNWQWSVFLDMDFERTNIANSKKYRKEVLEAYKASSRYPPHWGFKPDYRGLDMALRKMAQGNLEWTIGRGNYNADSLQEYIDQQKEEGIDAIVAVIQSQLDEWRKENDARE